MSRIITKKKTVIENNKETIIEEHFIVCEVCGHVNSEDKDLCEVCSNYLNLRRTNKDGK